jgi:hypothetical protein
MSDQHESEAVRAGIRSTSREYREYLLDRLPSDHRDGDPFAGLVRDDDVRHLLAFARKAWARRDRSEDPEDVPDDPLKTQFIRDRLDRAASTTGTTAVRNGNVSQLEFMSGQPEYQNDVSGLRTLQKWENWLLDSEQCKIIYLADHMGRGKTDFSHLTAEIVEFRSEKRDDLEPAEFACNIPSSDLKTVDNWQDFNAWVRSGSVESNRWFFMDEGSQALTGYSDDREEVERLMSRLVKLARKFGVNIVIIGHTGMDLHADLRRLSDYVTKPSLKTARVYLTVKRGEGAGHLFDLDGIPAAKTYGFDTADTASWSWSGALDGDEDDSDVLDATETKEMIARRAAVVYQKTDLSMKKACRVLSDDDFSISTTMLQNAQNGDYGKLPTA